MVEGIQFDEPTYSVPSSVRNMQNKGLSAWLIEKGLVRDKKQAQLVLLGVIGISIIISLFFINNFGKVEITEKNIFNPETADPDINDMR